MLVRDTFKAMLASDVDQLVLTTGPSYRLSGFDSLTLRLMRDDDVVKRLKRVRSGSGVGFEWVADHETWRSYLGLIGGLFNRGRPGHQYLTDEGRDDGGTSERVTGLYGVRPTVEFVQIAMLVENA